MSRLINGIDLDGLASHAQTKEYPPTVKGRTVHVDGDFLAYQCSWEPVDDPKTLDDIKNNVQEALNVLKGFSAAEHATIHLTPKQSDKGKRYEIALLKEYQGNREDKVKPRWLDLCREHMANDLGAILHLDCEADDGMSSMQYAAIARGEESLSVIATKDKDLRMVPGWHLQWDLGTLVHTDAWGSIAADSGKVRGYGTKFFWSQVLTGDNADNISGLQWVMGNILNVVDRTKAIQDAYDRLEREPGHVKSLTLINERQPKSCGPVMACKILENVHNDQQAFAVCKALYKAQAEQGYPFLNWRDASIEVPYGEALLSEMQLLWMRRVKNDPLDVVKWLQSLAQQEAA